MGYKVELNIILKLFSIFTRKKWIENEGHDEILKNFAELIESMDEKQVELLLELTERYTWITFNDYYNYLRSILIKLYSSYLSGVKNLYVFPIIKPSDENQIKSGHAVIYMMEGAKNLIPEYNGINFKKLQYFQDISPEKLQLQDDEYLILVDDFIGSGNTLKNTLLEVCKNGTLKDKFSIASVVIQQEALNFLEEKNINCVFGLEMAKGITNFYQEPDLTEKLNLMKKIEDRICKVKNYRFGYEKSEALVSLIKTPNNTFPIFWKECSYKGKILKAPFSRF